MAFINTDEALPKEEGIYRVMVHAMNDTVHESKAKYSMDKGFEILEKNVAGKSIVESWWTVDNIR